MIRDLVLPQLSMGMSEGTIAEWVVEEGGFVDKDDLLVLVETEKVVSDLPSAYRGYVHICVQKGETVPVEVLIAQIAETEEEYQQLTAGTTEARMAAALVTAATKETAVELAPTATAGGRRQAVSGLARKVAEVRGLDLAGITGSGPGGRIVRRDVMAALGSSAAAMPRIPATMTAPLPLEEKGMRALARIPMVGMRKAVAERMIQSKTTAAHTYVFFEVDVTKLLAARETMLAREKELNARISMTALYVKALAIACQHVPICNATLVDGQITVWGNVNVGIAVALPGKTDYESGLIVPVVRNAEAKSVLALDREIKDLVERAKTGKLAPGDTADGTVTLSSAAGFMPGQWCVSTPLINQPQVFNFQPGSPIEKPVVVDGQIVVRTMLPCGLSFDHRAMDGDPVARFNRKIADLLANPELMLL